LEIPWIILPKVYAYAGNGTWLSVVMRTAICMNDWITWIIGVLFHVYRGLIPPAMDMTAGVGEVAILFEKTRQ
jgi:hypothetical protein